TRKRTVLSRNDADTPDTRKAVDMITCAVGILPNSTPDGNLTTVNAAKLRNKTGHGSGVLAQTPPRINTTTNSPAFLTRRYQSIVFDSEDDESPVDDATTKSLLPDQARMTEIPGGKEKRT